MSQATHRDLEVGNDTDGRRDHSQSTPNQPLQGESSFGDSSGPLFFIYSKAAEEEDNRMVECWQKDADGILIFTGLFSAAVAALLSVTVQDLRPNSQDTSAFYLGNIYEVLADPNVTRASIPSPVAKPPPFSPPRYAVWVNILWFLSLVMSVSCALLATSLHQWARRYIRLTQPARCSPETRARMRAFFANGVDKMHIPWAVEGLPTLLHLSLFLFFGGLVIFLFNVDQEVFTGVVWWIGLFSVVYGLITLLPLIRQDSPYYTPLSNPAWFLYAGIQYVTFKVLAFITSGSYGSLHIWKRCRDSGDRYRHWMLGGVEKIAEEAASERSSEIDVRILGWTISALGNDDSLEKFFDAIPGFFSSRLVKNLERDFPWTLLKTFWGALDGFMGRTLSSNSVTESVKAGRVIICGDIISTIPCLFRFHYESLSDFFDQAPVSIERLQAMARWRTHKNVYVADYARVRVAKNLASMQERDDDWIAFTSEVYGLAAHDLWDNIAHGGDNVLLVTLIDVSRRAIHNDELGLVEALTQFDIRHTLPGLQHGFCTLWNELVQQARNPGRYSTPIYLLDLIRHLYIALHQGTDVVSVPTAFSVPSSYPLCVIASHRPDSTPHLHITNSPPDSISTQPGDLPDVSPYPPSRGGSTIPQQAERTNIIVGSPSPSNPTSTSEIGGISHAPTATPLTKPVHSNPCPTDASTGPTGGVAALLQDIASATALSHSTESSIQQDKTVPCAVPELDQTTSTVPKPVHAPASPSAPVPASASLILNKPSGSCDAGAASTSEINPLLPASSVVGFSIPASFLPSRIPPLPDAEFLTLFNTTTPSHPTGNVTVPRLRARGLVNTGSMCFANSVLQLLVHTPPFWNLLKELGDLKGQHGEVGAETGGGATPLVDATMKFFEEFVFKDESLLAQQPPQQAAERKPREDEEARKGRNTTDSFEPMYMYDAMKEKILLKNLLDGQQQDAEELFCSYLDALDEELLSLCTSINVYRPASTAPEIEERVMSQSGMTLVGKRALTAKSVELPLMRIFGGKFRSIVRAPNQPDTVTIEDWRSLQLDIQHDLVHTIEDALARISHLQPVQLGPSGLSETSHQVLMEVLPPILVLHLKRFMYDVNTDGVVKISKPVQFAPELEIPLEIMAPVAGKSVEPVHYKLYGVLYHHGESLGSGHYTVEVLHPKEDGSCGESWLYIDDEAVSAVRHDDVFGSHDNERVDDWCAYMLFYCRTAPPHGHDDPYT